ncbi:chalcone isomerase family protein [Kaarinaea lacus]
MQSSANNTTLQKKQPNASERLRLFNARMSLLIMAVIVVSSVASAGQPTKISFDEQTTLQPVGTGTIRWFGFTIYDASLWTASGDFKNLTYSLPVALHITYQKSIKSSALANRTAKEWKKLDIYSAVERQQWEQRLTAIWPSVKPGDSITTLVTATKQTQFYYNKELIKTINDPEFGVALLSIWLHPNTSQPELRRKLIGHREG